MASDAYFEIGTTHLICQDYALAGDLDGLSYAIISDGCSTAKHSEVGAQILCHAAQYYLGLYKDLFQEQMNVTFLAALFGNSVLKRALDVARLYPISRGALQATLIVAVMDQKTRASYVFGWGDGVIVYDILSGKRAIVSIDYPSTNAPFYLVTDRDEYQKQFGAEGSVRYCFYSAADPGDLSEVTERFEHWSNPYVVSSSVFKGVTIGTDGLTQYLEEQNPVLLPDVVNEIVDFPSTKGTFVQRTMNFIRKRKMEWSHTDDVAVASVILKE